ncbi:hypothetical protein FA95DRAFT_1458573, partial [Auriscalpium vulgare]
YKGEVDIETLDKWVYEVEAWKDQNDLDDQTALSLMGKFLAAKPSQFFMKHVAMSLPKWTLKLFYEALFHYCFPRDFKMRMRESLINAEQGDREVQDFLRDIETLATRFSDITHQQVIQIFWRGMRPYLRYWLIEKGLNPEISSLAKLAKYATRREEAY